MIIKSIITKEKIIEEINRLNNLLINENDSKQKKILEKRIKNLESKK